MGRKKSEERKKAKDIYCRRVQHGKVLLKDIAEELDVSPGSIRNWKREDKWDELAAKMSLIEPKNVTKLKKVIKSSEGTGSRGSIGNRGGGAPKGNTNAIKHGAYCESIFNSLDPEIRNMAYAFLEGLEDGSEKLIDTSQVMLMLRQFSIQTRESTTFVDSFGGEHEVKFTEEARDEGTIKVTDQLYKLEVFKDKVIARKEKEDQVRAQIEFENKLKLRNAERADLRLELDLKKANLHDDDEDDNFGVVLLPEKSIGKVNESYELEPDEN